MMGIAELAGSLRVLVVENDAADAELIGHALSRMTGDTSMDLIGTRDQLVERLADRPYDVILADYRLGEWTGMDVLDQVRRLGLDLPVILVTGTLGDEHAVDCVKSGVADYILKNNLARLPLAIIRAVGERRSRDDARRAQQRMEAAQREIREREERFRGLADNIDEVFFVMNARHTETLYINPAYEKIWGRSRQSLYDSPQSFTEALPAEDRAHLQEYMLRVERGEQAGKLHFRVIQPDGGIRWVLARAVAILDENGEVHQISGVALDITESREAELALEESADRFRKLADASFDAIDVAQDGLIYEVNRGFLKMFGYERMEDVVGRPVIDFVADESIAEVQRRLRGNMEGTYELVGQRKDGARLELEATARTHAVAGRPARITALRDMTERRALEMQFRQAQKMEAVGRLAGGVAHDFNNLLTIISSYAGLVLDDYAVSDPRREDMEEIRRAAAAAAGLTRQLLAFSRQQVIEPRIVTVDSVVANAEKMLRRLLGEDVEMVTLLGSGSKVKIDPGQLEQVIMNLAVNARDAMPTGGTLTIETGTIDANPPKAGANHPSKAGRSVLLTVQDTGTGMDEPTRERIFEPFFTTKAVGKGTGLGLSTVYGIIEQSNGSIRVVSKLGAGTRFEISLPCVEDGSSPEECPPVRLAVPRGNETVLLVEDAPAVREAVRTALVRYGYTVLEAPSGSVGLSLAVKHRASIDLLITDVVMPGMSGAQMARELAAVRPDTKVLFMSGYTPDTTLRHGVLADDCTYLQKPFGPDVLARKVREVLDGRAASS